MGRRAPNLRSLLFFIGLAWLDALTLVMRRHHAVTIAPTFRFTTRHRKLQQTFGHLDQHRLPLRLVDVLAFARQRAMSQCSDDSERAEQPAFGSG